MYASARFSYHVHDNLCRIHSFGHWLDHTDIIRRGGNSWGIRDVTFAFSVASIHVAAIASW